MKKKFIYLGLIALMSVSILTSYKDGPAAHGLGNRSGSQGTNTCSSSSCHPNENSSLNLNILIRDASTGNVATEYVAGTTYNVYVVGVIGGATSYTHFGFQSSVVDGSNANAGTLTPTTNQTLQTPSGVSLIEHSTPIAKSALGFIDTFTWVAPSAGTGDVTFYTRMLACNNNNNKSDDLPNKSVVTIGENTPSSLITNNNTKLSIAPNPSKGMLNVSVDDAVSRECSYTIIDMMGRIIMQSVHDFHRQSLVINTSGWSEGNYNIVIKDGTRQYAKLFSVVK